MSRSERLLGLLQALRRYRNPVSGQVLAGELGVSLRTLYRDISSLKAQGAHIDGEAGMGYVLRPGFMLPPLMFTEDELEALVLGSRWVTGRADRRLAAAAGDALAKIAAVLPPDLRENVEATGLLVGTPAQAEEQIDIGELRKAIRAERKLAISYADVAGATTERTVWPIALGFFERTRVLAAWCELRQDYRHFRTDRIVSLEAVEGRFPKRRRVLLKEWRTLHGFAARRDEC